MYIPTVAERIQQRRYQMLVHSYLYYQLNQNIVDDHTFDGWANELVALQDRFPDVSRTVKYYEEFKDFDGSSGYNLPYNMSNIQAIGNRLLKYRGNYNER